VSKSTSGILFATDLVEIGALFCSTTSTVLFSSEWYFLLTTNQHKPNFSETDRAGKGKLAVQTYGNLKMLNKQGTKLLCQTIANRRSNPKRLYV
jgi:hypothetical protein